jgi:hypothetical protein
MMLIVGWVVCEKTGLTMETAFSALLCSDHETALKKQSLFIEKDV